jgi:hypothetical protein
LDYSLGYPIVLSNEDGSYAEPPPDAVVQAAQWLGDDGSTEATTLALWLRQGAEVHPAIAAHPRATGAVAGQGVFACADIPACTLIGAYQGLVRTEEEWGAEHADSNFSVVVNDGASGVVIDGGVGNTNVLRWLNHSCEPCAEMRFAWSEGCWHALLITMRAVVKGEEVTFDYALVTEDDDDPALAQVCLCRAQRCRGSLFEFRPW